MSSESGSKNGTMEAMSNEGPHISDYEQKSEILWNEVSQKTKVQHIEYNFFKRLNLTCKKKKTEKEECNFRAHAYDIYLVSLSGLKY